MSAVQTIAGGCLCGAVRFTAVPKHRAVDACHCGMCRRWSAGPFMALDSADSVTVAEDAPLGVYRSSEWAERCFCKLCGTPLFYRLVGKNLSFVSAETLDDRAGYHLATQIFVDEKPDYYAFANDTKMMTGADVFAAFSGADK